MSYSIQHERNLIKSLDPFYVLCHFFEKYSKAKPTTEMLVELWSKSVVDLRLGTITIPPFDPVLKQIRIKTARRDPNTPEELILTFPKQAVLLADCEQRFGDYGLYFDEETMTSSFIFENIRSIFVDKISCRFHGKFSEKPNGDFAYIEPTNFDRIFVDRDKLKFKSFALHFRQMGW